MWHRVWIVRGLIGVAMVSAGGSAYYFLRAGPGNEDVLDERYAPSNLPHMAGPFSAIDDTERWRSQMLMKAGITYHPRRPLPAAE